MQFQVKTPTGTVLAATFRVEDGSFGQSTTRPVHADGQARRLTFIEARVGTMVLRTQLTIDITWEQNGARRHTQRRHDASGGYGGVGGEGPGGPASDDVRTALDAKPKADAALSGSIRTTARCCRSACSRRC